MILGTMGSGMSETKIEGGTFTPVGDHSLGRPVLAGRLGRIALLTGWRAALLSALLGILGTAAMPPFGILPLLVPAFAGLFLQVDSAPRPRAAFWRGFWFALGHFAVGLYWISNAMFVDIASFWWMVPPTALGLPALFGLMVGAMMAAYSYLAPRGWLRIALFAALWSATELLRGWIFTGFPWHATGYAWIALLPGAQLAALVGVFGLGFLTVAGCAATVAGGWRAPVAALVVTAAALGWGGWRLASSPTEYVPGVTLRLVQPAIQQTLKWDPAQQAINFRRHVELSQAPTPKPLAAIIWPETATTFILEEHQEGRAIVSRLAPAGGLLITGTPRIVRGDGEAAIYNGLVALDGDGTLRAAYDKFHLVPFGEYVPGRGLLPIDKIVPGRGDFSAGPGPRTLHLPGLPPAAPLICYEIIFPGAVTDPADRPAWLLNITNDAWFGMSAGPYQHFAIARMRAIEEGVPLVRAANTGISGAADPNGRVTARLDLGESGALDVDLPAALPAPTLYSRLRDLPLGFLLAAILLTAGWQRNRCRRG